MQNLWNGGKSRGGVICMEPWGLYNNISGCSTLHFKHIRESVDSLCRDGTDTPYTQYKIKLSKSLQKITSKLL